MDSIASFLDEGVIRFSDKIRIVGMDRGRICVLELLMGDDYIKTTNIKELEAPVDLFSISKIMKRFSNPEELYISYDEMSNAVTIKGKIKNRTKTFKSQTIDIDMTDFEDPIPKLSKIKYNAVFQIEANELLDAMKDVELFAEFFTIESSDNNIRISASNPTGECITDIEIEDLYGNEKSSYQTERIKKIIKPIGNCKVLIMFNSNYPIAIYDKLSSKSHMLYYLAPRVVDEDEEDDY